MKNKKILITVLSAILTGLSQHSYSVGFLAWFSLIPFLFVLSKLNSFKDAFKFSFIWGFIYHLLTIYWLAQNIGTIPIIALFSMLLTVFYLSFNTVLIVFIWYYLKKYYKKYNLLLIPIIWVSIEYVKSYGLLAFPWISLANSQLAYLYPIQIAEFTGIYGVCLNTIIYSLLINQSIKKVYLLLVTFLFPWLFGYMLYNNLDEYKLDDLNIVLIQPNIKLSDSRDYSKGNELLNKLIDKTKSAIDNNTDLVIWPEAALPFHNIKDGKTFNFIKKKLLINDNIKILSGDITFNNDKIYNSVVLFDNASAAPNNIAVWPS